jgi:hypothetical protein
VVTLPDTLPDHLAQITAPAPAPSAASTLTLSIIDPSSASPSRLTHVDEITTVFDTKRSETWSQSAPVVYTIASYK